MLVPRSATVISLEGKPTRVLSYFTIVFYLKKRFQNKSDFALLIFKWSSIWQKINLTNAKPKIEGRLLWCSEYASISTSRFKDGDDYVSSCKIIGRIRASTLKGASGH